MNSLKLVERDKLARLQSIHVDRMAVFSRIMLS